MIIGALQALLLVVLPALLFIGGAVFMMRATGRARFRQRRNQPASEPPNLRFRGYDAADTMEYWEWLGPEGSRAELRFLRADMVFPFWYAGCLLASMYFALVALEHPLSSAVAVAPVAVAVVADWVENLIHIRQLRRFMGGQPVQVGEIQLASLATSTKLLFFWGSTLIMVALAASVFISSTGA